MLQEEVPNYFLTIFFTPFCENNPFRPSQVSQPAAVFSCKENHHDRYHHNRHHLRDHYHPGLRPEKITVATNPRYKNGNLRRKYRARFKAMAAPCGICGGRLGPIHYDEPSDSLHPLSFVIDEIKPVSRWREFGYASAAEAAQDWSNLQAAHYCCNAAKSNKTSLTVIRNKNIIDGDW